MLTISNLGQHRPQHFLGSSRTAPRHRLLARDPASRDPDGNPIDKPSSLAEQLAWLVQAGFVGVDCHWLVAGHAIFSGRRP